MSFSFLTRPLRWHSRSISGNSVADNFVALFADHFVPRSLKGDTVGLSVVQDPSRGTDVTLFFREAPTIDIENLLRDMHEIAAVVVVGKRVRLTISDHVINALGSRLAAGNLSPLVPPPCASSAVVTFCDPNANKALHLGHMRNLVIGDAFARLLEITGIDVARQSFVCDVGRIAAETTAGYIEHHSDMSPEHLGVRPDDFVGLCYSDYVHHAALPSLSPDPDVPHRGSRDSAERVLDQLRDGDPHITAIWRRLRRWALDGHDHTLKRLAIDLRSIYESRALDSIDRIVAAALELGVFRYALDGAVELTVPEGEPRVIMIRADGMETGYMRRFAIWHDMHYQTPNTGLSVNIMGSEWVPTFYLREHALAQMQRCPTGDLLKCIGVGTVVVSGRSMKSRRGDSVLIEDCLDGVVDHVMRRGLADSANDAEVIANIVSRALFLQKPASKPVNFTWGTLLSEDANSGWVIARAFQRASRRSDGSGTYTPNPYYRAGVLRACELAKSWRDALVLFDVSKVVHCLRGLSRWYLLAPDSSDVANVAVNTLAAGMLSIGLLHSEHLGEA